VCVCVRDASKNKERRKKKKITRVWGLRTGVNVSQKGWCKPEKAEGNQGKFGPVRIDKTEKKVLCGCTEKACLRQTRRKLGTKLETGKERRNIHRYSKAAPIKPRSFGKRPYKKGKGMEKFVSKGGGEA